MTTKTNKLTTKLKELKYQEINHLTKTLKYAKKLNLDPAGGALIEISAIGGNRNKLFECFVSNTAFNEYAIKAIEIAIKKTIEEKIEILKFQIKEAEKEL